MSQGNGERLVGSGNKICSLLIKHSKEDVPTWANV